MTAQQTHLFQLMRFLPFYTYFSIGQKSFDKTVYGHQRGPNWQKVTYVGPTVDFEGPLT